MGRKSKGNVMDLVTVGITILAMSIIVMVYFECTGVMLKKLEISQLSRQYILKMETIGYLDEQSNQELMDRLAALGMQGIDISGTTVQPVHYGDTIVLNIKGTIGMRTMDTEGGVWNEGFLSRQYVVEENRVSTAKN